MNHQLSDAKIEYYATRIGQGISATRKGITGTPLTTALHRWGEPIEVFVDKQFDAFEMPAKVRHLVRMIEQYAEAVDAEDDVAPYRFQKVGQMWTVHFSIEGVVKRGNFNEHRGFQHYVSLLAAPHRAVESVQLAGLADLRTLALLEDEKQFTHMERHDEQSIQTYHAAFTLLSERLAAARMNGDIVAMEEIETQIDRLKSALSPGASDHAGPKLNTLRRQTVGKSKTALKIHKAVGTAMRRAIRTLLDMSELAKFLEMTVIPEGYAFAYRPLRPEPHWLL